jgi:peptidoglycan-associated lipoprotein
MKKQLYRERICMKYSIFSTVVMIGLLFSGCSQKSPELADQGSAETFAQTNPQLSTDSQISNMEGIDETAQYATVDERIAAIEKEIEPIYFATDSYRISENELYKIDKDAQIFNGELARDLSIKVEGNCDEWGTDEYNYALGLKRAKSAKDALSIAGVEEGRMSLVSYGESKPICTEHNEACWQQNRRVDFKLLP